MILTLCCFLMHGASFSLATIEGIQIYQKNLHLSEARKQKLANDIDRYHRAGNLWDALSADFSLQHYEGNPEVQNQINWFMQHKDYLKQATSHAGPYLYFILQQTRKRHLPAELALLPMIESAYNPFAYSSAGAAGIWQIMPRTASGFGIKQDWWYDGRRDVVASTRAALDYLAYLGNFFAGNWLLSIAAYDTGEGNVLNAIKKNIRGGQNTDFWSLPLSQETRNYVPRLLALATIISHPDEYPVELPAIPNAPYLAQIDIGEQIDLKNAALLANISLNSLKRLNPGHNQTATDPHGPYKLILPIEKVQKFSENLAKSPFHLRMNWIRYKVKMGDTLATIAKHFNIKASALRKANPTLASNVQPGKQLLIPQMKPTLAEKLLTSEQLYASSINATNGKSSSQQKIRLLSLTQDILKKIRGPYALQPGDTLYMVRQGDTLEKIANRFNMNTYTILAINQLNQKIPLTAGDKLIIPTHIIEQAKNNPLSQNQTFYLVKKDDTIESIANQFHTTPSAIRIINLLSSSHLEEGDRLIIPSNYNAA